MEFICVHFHLVDFPISRFPISSLTSYGGILPSDVMGFEGPIRVNNIIGMVSI